MKGKIDMAAVDKEVAIVLATFNGEKYLEEQLQSLINQTYKEFVCYMHDDGSDDGTTEILNRYLLQFPENFQLLKYEGRHGAIGNFMSIAKYVRENTKEPYIFFADQDDYWEPMKVERELEVLKKEEDPSKPFLVYCDQEIVDGNLNVISSSGMAYSKRRAGVDDSFKELVFENCAPGCTIAMNRPCLELAVDNANDEHIVMHDWWFMLIARCFGEIAYVDEALMKYRQHGLNSLGADNKVISAKIKKYLHAMKQSLRAKADHVNKCKLQIRDISMIGGCAYSEEINRIVEVEFKGKIHRIIFYLSKGYIRAQECFTLLFV